MDFVLKRQAERTGAQISSGVDIQTDFEQTRAIHRQAVGERIAMSISSKTQRDFITRDQLKTIYPKSSDAEIDAAHRAFNRSAHKYGLTDPKNQQIFFAQIKHEGAGKIFGSDENMNYSVDALKKTFKNFRNNPGLAEKYGRKPGQKANQQMIANIAYGNRMGNNSIDDGYKYRGFGLIQITGKENFNKTAATMGITGEELANNRDNPEYRMETAMAYWKNNNLDKVEDIDESTKIINRYTKSYEERRNIYNDLSSVFKAEEKTTVASVDPAIFQDAEDQGLV